MPTLNSEGAWVIVTGAPSRLGPALALRVRLLAEELGLDVLLSSSRSNLLDLLLATVDLNTQVDGTCLAFLKLQRSLTDCSMDLIDQISLSRPIRVGAGVDLMVNEIRDSDAPCDPVELLVRVAFFVGLFCNNTNVDPETVEFRFLLRCSSTSSSRVVVLTSCSDSESHDFISFRCSWLIRQNCQKERSDLRLIVVSLHREKRVNMR